MRRICGLLTLCCLISTIWVDAYAQVPNNSQILATGCTVSLAPFSATYDDNMSSTSTETASSNTFSIGELTLVCNDDEEKNKCPYKRLKGEKITCKHNDIARCKASAEQWVLANYAKNKELQCPATNGNCNFDDGIIVMKGCCSRNGPFDQKAGTTCDFSEDSKEIICTPGVICSYKCTNSCPVDEPKQEEKATGAVG